MFIRQRSNFRMVKKQQNFPGKFVFFSTHVFESNSLVVWPGKGIREQQAAKRASVHTEYHNIQYTGWPVQVELSSSVLRLSDLTLPDSSSANNSL